MRENECQQQVDSRGPWRQRALGLLPLAVAGFIIHKRRRSGGEEEKVPQPHAQVLRHGAVEQRGREPGPVDWAWAMPLRLTAGTVPGGDAAARACEEERRQGRRLRVRPAGAGRAAAACRRWHRGQSSVSAPYCYLIKHGRARQIKADAAACVSWLAVRESICPKEEGVGGCGACGGAGWVLCDFCQGKKNNVKSETGSRVYRRCPTCKAVSNKDYFFASTPSVHLFF